MNKGDVVYLKTEEYYSPENRHYLIVSDAIDNDAFCISGKLLTTIRVNKSFLIKAKPKDMNIHTPR